MVFLFFPFYVSDCTLWLQQCAPCLWMTLIFKLNSIDLHNVSLAVVKSYSKILICSVILGPSPASTGAGRKNSTCLNERWILGGDLIALHKSFLIKYLIQIPYVCSIMVPDCFSGWHRLKKKNLLALKSGSYGKGEEKTHNCAHFLGTLK